MKSKKTKKSNPIKKQVEALAKVSKAIASDLLLDDILSLIVAVTARLMKSNTCSIQLIDEKNNELVIRASKSISDEYNKKTPLKLGEGVAGKVALTKKPIAVKDIHQESEYKYRDIAKKEGLRSHLSVPLSVKGKVIGVLNSYTSRPHTFSKMEIETLQSIADQAAIAIENAELVVKSNAV